MVTSVDHSSELTYADTFAGKLPSAHAHVARLITVSYSAVPTFIATFASTFQRAKTNEKLTVRLRVLCLDEVSPAASPDISSS